MTAERQLALKTSLVYLAAAVFFALFGGIYELFSHGVYSYAMIYAFAFPLIGGALPFLGIGLSKKCPLPGRIFRNAYHSALSAWTVGSIFQGVLEIYGTTNPLSRVYWIAGFILMAAAFGSLLMQRSRNSDNNNRSNYYYHKRQI